MVTFAAEIDPDAHYSRMRLGQRRERATRSMRSPRKRGHPELAANILALNKGRDVLPHPKRKPHHTAPPIPKLRTIKQLLRTNARSRCPGT